MPTPLGRVHAHTCISQRFPDGEPQQHPTNAVRVDGVTLVRRRRVEKGRPRHLQPALVEKAFEERLPGIEGVDHDFVEAKMIPMVRLMLSRDQRSKS